MFSALGTGMIVPREYSATAVAGSWTQYLSNITSGLIIQIYVKSTVDTSMFDVVIKDSKDRSVYSKKNITSLLNEVDKSTPIAQALGPYRIQILNATPVNETFDVMLMVQEIR